MMTTALFQERLEHCRIVITEWPREIDGQRSFLEDEPLTAKQRDWWERTLAKRERELRDALDEAERLPARLNPQAVRTARRVLEPAIVG